MLVTPPPVPTCAPRTAWHPLFIEYLRPLLPAARTLQANVHLVEPRAILGIDLTEHPSGTEEIGLNRVGFPRLIADLVISGDGIAAEPDAGPLQTLLASQGQLIVGKLTDPRSPLSWQDECLMHAERLMYQATHTPIDRLHPRQIGILLIGDVMTEEMRLLLERNHKQRLIQSSPGCWEYSVMNSPVRIIETAIACQVAGQRLLYLFSRRFLAHPEALLPLESADAARFQALARLVRELAPRRGPALWGYNDLRRACDAAMRALLLGEDSAEAPHYSEAQRDDKDSLDKTLDLPRNSSSAN
jgi:hypothetical protein